MTQEEFDNLKVGDRIRNKGDGYSCEITAQQIVYVLDNSDCKAGTPEMWEKVEPTPEYEEVEVKRWECRKCGSMYTAKPPHNSGHVYGVSSSICTIDENQLLELTGTYKRPKPRKVVKEWTFEGGFNQVKATDMFPLRDNRPFWVANTKGTFTYRAEVEDTP